MNGPSAIIIISNLTACSSFSPLCLGLKQIREAEQYLSQAQWAVLKAPDCSPALQSQLYRNLGLLELARGHYKEARKHLAEDVILVY